MKRSEEAREAIGAAFWPCEPRASDGPRDPVDVPLSDGRTIGEHLDAEDES